MNNLSVVLDKPSAVFIGANDIDADRMDGAFYNNKYIKNEINLKKSGLRIEFLENVIERINSPIGWQGIPSESYLPHGIGTPLIRVQNVSDLILEEESLIGVKDLIYNEQPAIQAQANDIIITRVGTIGRVCRIPEKINKIAMGQNLTRIKMKDSIIESGFTLAYMSSKFCQLQMERYAYGGVQPSLTNKNIKQLLIPIPSFEIQKYIGDKIRKAEKLREEAKKIKKEAEGLLIYELEIKELNEKLKTKTEKYVWADEKKLSDRIDGEFYKKEFLLNNEHLNKLCKQGVSIKKLKDIISNGSYGILPSSSHYGKGEVELLRSTNIKEFLIDDSDVIKVPEDYYKDKVKIYNGDILLEIKGQCYSGAVVENIKNKIIVNGSIFKFSVKEEFNNYYVLGYLLSQSGQLQKKQNLANSIISYLSIECINKLQIPILSKEKQNIIGEKYRMYVQNFIKSKEIIKEAKQDIEDLIEGDFDMSKINETN